MKIVGVAPSSACRHLLPAGEKGVLAAARLTSTLKILVGANSNLPLSPRGEGRVRGLLAQMLA